MQNAGGDPGCIYHLTKGIQENPWAGWDVTFQQVRDIREDPLIADPTDVVVSAIQSAVSVTSLLLTAEASITSIGDVGND
jgi:chaperonin GroEL (HSP60 family)